MQLNGHRLTFAIAHDDIPPPPPPPPYPGYNTGCGDYKSYSPPPYTITNMHSTPYGAGAAHVPAPFSANNKPDIFNVWGIMGYTGNINTSGSLSPQDTACHLAKIQQAMTGHNNYDFSAFSQTPTASNDSNDKHDDGKDNDVPMPPDPPEVEHKKLQESYPSYDYYPAYPGYGYNFGLAPPPCPPDPPKEKKEKKDSKCKRCKGASGHPVKKIKKMDYELLCWACVWRAYASAAEEVWKESEAVDGPGEDDDD